MLDEITSAIDATTDASSRKGLRRCLRLLSEAISNWGGHALAPSGLVIAGATSRGAVVLHADAGWPPFDEALAARLRQEFAPDAKARAFRARRSSPAPPCCWAGLESQRASPTPKPSRSRVRSRCLPC